MILIPNFMTMCPVAAELFHANIWTDMTKLSVTFRNFVNVPRDLYQYHLVHHGSHTYYSEIKPVAPKGRKGNQPPEMW